MKLPKENAPLLVVGLGGTGKDAVLQIKKKFAKYFDCDPNTQTPARTAYLVLDADHNGIGTDPSELTHNEYYDLTVNGIGKMVDPENKISLPAYVRSWLDPNVSFAKITWGAGGIRQAGRFQLFQHIQKIINNKIRPLINSIVIANEKDEYDHNNKKILNVVICGGLAGGTGSGTVLDMAYVLRDYIDNNHNSYELRMIGMFVTPEVSIDNAGANWGEDQILGARANGFAAMKEIDYWMSQPEHKQVIEQTYWEGHSVKWNKAPFDLLVYLDNKREDGTLIPNPYMTNMNNIAEMMLHFFSKGSGAVHNIGSFLSNLIKYSTSIDAGRTFPVCYRVISLGTKDTAVINEDIAAYEGKLTLDSTLSEPVFDSVGKQLISPEEIAGAAMVRHALDSEEDVDAFMQKMTEGCHSMDDFFAANPDPLTDSMFEQGAIRALNSVNEGPHRANVMAWYGLLKEAAEKAALDDYEKQWDNFRQLTKDYITNINIGPIAFRRMLTEGVANRCASSVETWQGINNSARTTYNSVVGPDSNADALLEKMMQNDPMSIALGILFWSQNVKAYREQCETACSAIREMAYADAKTKYGKLLQTRIAQYAENLGMLLRGLASMQSDLNVQVENSNANTTGLVDFNKIRNQLDAKLHEEEKNNEENSVAKAKDALLKELVEVSLSLESTRATTNEEAALAAQTLRKKLAEFADSCFKTLHMTNLDVLLEAAVDRKPQETEKDYEDRQIQQMQHQIAPYMKDAALPMLEQRQGTNYGKDPVLYQYIAVPKNATKMRQGMNLYKGTENTVQVSDSLIEDRIFWLNMKAGMPLCSYRGIEAQEKAYEEAIKDADLSAGIHLIDNYPINLLSVEAGNVQDSWRRLPSPVPAYFYEGRHGDTFNQNIEYCKKLFKAAVANKSICFERDTEEFSVYRAFVTSKGNTLGVKEALKKIAEAQDEKVSATENIRRLEELKTAHFVQKFDFGKFMKPYATFMNLRIEAVDGADEDMIKECEKNRAAVRNELCAYILYRNPAMIDILQQQKQIYDELSNRIKYWTDKEGDDRKAVKLAETYARVLASGEIYYDTGMYCYDDVLGNQQEFIDIRKVVPNTKQYKEAALMIKLAQEGISKTAHRDAINEKLQKYSSSLLKKLRKAGSSEEYENKVAQQVEKLGYTLKLAKTDVDMEDDLRIRLQDIYNAMIETLQGDLDV